jgi:hypothetical protein
MSPTRTQPDPPTTSELVEGVLFYPIALVVSATVCPGFTLCIPALLFGTLLVIIPLAAIALVVALAAAVLAAPFVLVRAVRGLNERRARSRTAKRIRAHGQGVQPAWRAHGSATAMTRSTTGSLTSV